MTTSEATVSGHEATPSELRRAVVFLGSVGAATSLVLTGVIVLATAIASGPPVRAAYAGTATDIAGWLSLPPDFALSAVGLVTAGVFALALTEPKVDRLGPKEVSDDRARTVLLDLLGWLAVLLAGMAVLHLVTASAPGEARASSGSTLVIVILGGIAAIASQRPLRPRDLERELAGRAAQKLARESRAIETSWARNWNGLAPDADRPLPDKWSTAVSLGVVGAVVATTALGSVLSARPLSTFHVVAVGLAVSIYFYATPVAVVTQALLAIRSRPSRGLRLLSMVVPVMLLLLLLLFSSQCCSSCPWIFPPRVWSQRP